MGSSWSHFTESPQGRLSVVHFLVCPSNKNCYNNVTFAGQKSLVTATICEHIFQSGFPMINSDLFPLEVDSHSLWRMTSLSFNFHREGQPWPRWCFSNWVAVIQIKACIFSTPSLAHHPQQEAETSLLFFFICSDSVCFLWQCNVVISATVELDITYLPTIFPYPGAVVFQASTWDAWRLE